MTNLTSLSSVQLRRAAAIKDQIETLQNVLSAILGDPSSAKTAPLKRKRRKMSAAARAKIGAAQKARWAKWKARKN